MSIIHNNASSTGLNQERNLHRSSTVYKPKESKTALNKYVGGFWCKIQLEEMDFFTGGSIIMDYITGILVKSILIMDLFFTNMQLLASQDVNWWTGVVWITCGLLWCFYQLFGLSFWRHPFTAEDPSVSKWWNATFLQIWWRNKLIYILDGLKVWTFSDFFGGVNYCLKSLVSNLVPGGPQLCTVLLQP